MLQSIFFSLVILFSTVEKSTIYSVDTSSSKVKWVGKKVTGQHNGSIDLKEASFVFDDGKLNSGSFTIDMTSLICEDLEGKSKKKLENHLKSDAFFGTDQFPTSTFTITKAVPQGPEKYKVIGDITIKGITEEIQFPVELIEKDGKATGTAKLTIDRSKFDIKYGSGSFFDDLGDKTIYDDFELEISIVASK